MAEEITETSSQAPSTSPRETLTLRALVSTKDAGVIIGKGGNNVANLRDETGVKAGVSKVVPGVHERVLTVSGDAESVAKAYRLIISQLIDANPPSPAASSPSSNTSIRLLISHNLMGTIIGRGGLKIKAIQDASGARMVASKDMLPQSTERIVEVQGSADAIGTAIEQIGKCLLEDWERGQGTVLFHPGPGTDTSVGRRSTNGYSTGSFNNNNNSSRRSNGGGGSGTNRESSGAKITEIRRLSGSKISIAKTPHDETVIEILFLTLYYRRHLSF
ncbi:cytoplasmic [Pyrrhoderma noxium]|uniref:Cytoplasmic n=1 Tax=Pyrrhoderma noxium TaxID=2282107 RepID=A0A286US15_9AGAM|nr:cytoplasmic [Pyrrhoderma noxium]